MKKIVFLLCLVISGMVFAGTCNWVADPDVYVRKTIELIKKNKLENKVYCGNDNILMVYYHNENYDELEIGFSYNEKEKREVTWNLFGDILDDFGNYIDKITPINIKGSDILEMPDKYNYRVYVYDPVEDDTYFIFKAVFDFSNKSDIRSSFYYSAKYFDNTDEEIVKGFKDLGYFPTEDEIY